MNNSEKKFIIETLKYKINQEEILSMLKSNKINWPNVLGFISYHRISGLIFDKINSIDVRLLDFPVFYSIYLTNQAQQIRNNCQLNEIKKMSAILNKYNIKYVFLKGMILNHTIFNPGTRSSNDIDILINKNSIETVTKLLNSLGYIQGKYDYKSNKIIPFNEEELNFSINCRGEICPFIKVINKPTVKVLNVDINFSLDWTPKYNQTLINRILKNRIKIKLDENNYIFSANIEDNIVQLCTHLYKDMALLDIVKKRKVFDFYKFVDIYYYINANLNKINFDNLIKEIKLFNAEKYVYFALIYLSTIFDDFKNEQILLLITKLEENINKDEVLNTIFDQYNKNEQLISNYDIKDRIFEYDIINKYSKEVN